MVQFVLGEHSIWSGRLRSQLALLALGKGQSVGLFALRLKFKTCTLREIMSMFSFLLKYESVLSIYNRSCVT